MVCSGAALVVILQLIHCSWPFLRHFALAPHLFSFICMIWAQKAHTPVCVFWASLPFCFCQNELPVIPVFFVSNLHPTPQRFNTSSPPPSISISSSWHFCGTAYMGSLTFSPHTQFVLWLTASSTGHLCNEDSFSRCQETNCMQAMLVQMSHR